MLEKCVDQLCSFLNDQQIKIYVVGGTNKKYKTAHSVATSLWSILNNITINNIHWEFGIYKHLYAKMKPKLEYYNLIKNNIFPLTPNNSQFVQNILACSDNKFRLFQAYMHASPTSKIFCNYQKRMKIRKSCYLKTSKTTIIKLNSKHKQNNNNKNNDNTKEIQTREYVMWYSNIIECISFGIDLNINCNKYYRHNILNCNNSNVISVVAGSDRMLDAYIGSVCSLTTFNSNSATNAVPTHIVVGDCDDGSVSQRLIIKKISHRRQDVNSLFKFPVWCCVLKFKVEKNKINSRMVSSTVVTMDTAAQIKLDNENFQIENVIEQPQALQLQNDFILPIEECVENSEWMKTLSMCQFYVIIHH